MIKEEKKGHDAVWGRGWAGAGEDSKGKRTTAESQRKFKSIFRFTSI